MKGARALFSSASVHWATPPELHAALDAEFHFTLDACPIGGNHSLTRSWAGERVYCNPPYGGGRYGILVWLERAREAAVAVYLLPARTDTYWWHEHAMSADEIRFLRGRLNFGARGPRGGLQVGTRAPFPSVVLVYRGTDG